MLPAVTLHICSLEYKLHVTVGRVVSSSRAPGAHAPNQAGESQAMCSLRAQINLMVATVWY